MKSALHGVLLTCPVILMLCAGAAAQCPNMQWQVGPGTAAGLQGTAYATLRFDPDGAGPIPERLIAGGLITAAGSSAVNNIAMYDPVSGWQGMSTGLNGRVRALTLHNGSIYAVGSFTASGATSMAGVAHWTGSNWEAVGASPADVDTIISYNGQLVIGGAFGIMGYDGATWSVFQGNVSGTYATVTGAARRVYALGLYQGDLVVGGHFATAGSTPVNCVARWNGSTWSSLGNGIYIPTGFSMVVHGVVKAFHTDGDTLYIGGSFEGSGAAVGPSILTVPSANIISWNGAAYVTLNAPCFSRWYEYTDVELIDGTLYVGGTVPLGCGGTTALYATYSPITTLWTTSSVGGSVQNIIKYNNDVIFDGHTAWRNGSGVELSTGVSPIVRSFTSGGGSMYAAGPRSAGGQGSGGVARWDGTAWHSIGFAPSASPFGARVVAYFNNEVYIGGDFASANSLPTGGLVRYNGTSFNTVGGTVNGDVQSMIVYNNALVVAGNVNGFGPLSSSYIARWDGTSWSAMGGGLNAPASNMTIHNGDLYAAGFFVGGNNVAKFDGAVWTLVPGGFDNAPFTLASYNGKLYAGGYFTHAGSSVASRIAAFDGTNWTDVGGGMNQAVTTLLPFNNHLFAAGYFTQAGLASTQNIAQWDGVSWSAVDGGLAPSTFSVERLGTFNDELLVGGQFTATSRGVSVSWARLGCATGCYPNCDNSTVAPLLTANDFQCFLNRFAASDPYANCDGSSVAPVLTANDFQCFLNQFAAGCT